MLPPLYKGQGWGGVKISATTQPMNKFDYTLDFKTIDFRQQPELDRVVMQIINQGANMPKIPKLSSQIRMIQLKPNLQKYSTKCGN